MAKASGFVLPVESVSSTEAVTFPGFPGIWLPGEPVALETLGGITMEEAREQIKALDLPLKEAKADVPDAEPASPPTQEPAVEPAETEGSG
jgi:hypothetical protein